jgi:hypothetical protein
LWLPPVRMQRRQRVSPFWSAILASFFAADYKCFTCFYYGRCPESETSWIIVLTSAMSPSQHVPSPATCVRVSFSGANFLQRSICFFY